MYHHLSLIFSLSIKESKKTVTEEQARIPIHVLTSLWSIKLHYKFIESSQDCNLMLTLNAKVEGKGNYTGFMLPRRTKDDISKICHFKCHQHLYKTNKIFKRHNKSGNLEGNIYS